MKVRLYVIVMLILVMPNSNLFGQQQVEINKKEFKHSKNGYKEALNSIKKADSYYQIGIPGAYRIALKDYLEAYTYNQNNAELNYKIGACYLHSTEKSRALSFLQKAYKEKEDVSPDITYLLGWALHLNYDMDDAIDFFNKFKKDQELLPKKNQLSILSTVDKKIKECETAKKLINEPIRVFIDNLGQNVNSQYPDYGPIISADESMLIFTSRREDAVGGELDPHDFQYNEDLYISYNDKKTGWSKAVNMKSLNTSEHDASIGLSPDGQILYTYKSTPNGTIFQSILEGDNWSKTKELGKNINSKYNETSASISYDGRYLYFVSDRPKDDFGYASSGGSDIFVSEKRHDGSWGPARNVGAPINTENNEEGVFIHPDGITMYFCSDRDESMGGYDIFYSESDEDGNWKQPVNIGYPVNTTDDDVFFVTAGNARYAYYSSAREGGYGLQDIYRITFLGPEKIIVFGAEDILIAGSNTTIQQQVKHEPVDVKNSRLTIIKGTIKDAVNGNPVSASIDVIDNDNNELISTLRSNISTGKYLVSLPSGKNYGIIIKADEYLFHSENVDARDVFSYHEINRDILLDKIEIGAKIILRNVFFDFEKGTLDKTSYPELNRILDILNAYPNISVEIGGHTDNIGSLKSNTELSDIRAKSVFNYLISRGIARSRLSSKGYAYLYPIATNDTEEGRQENRRVEIKIVGIK